MIRKLIFLILYLNILIAFAKDLPHTNILLNNFSTQLEKIVFYKNDNIYIKGFNGPGIIEIYSIIGNKIKDIEIQELENFILPYHLNSGNMYIIRVITMKKVETFKIVAS